MTKNKISSRYPTIYSVADSDQINNKTSALTSFECREDLSGNGRKSKP